MPLDLGRYDPGKLAYLPEIGFKLDKDSKYLQEGPARSRAGVNILVYDLQEDHHIF
jgi:hypothetical protein